jgi:lipoprotein-anchoring transpeptidase ErfK/SrfK
VKEGDFLGYVRAGTRVRLKSKTLRQGSGCPRGFYEVEPRGFVCADRTVAIDPEQNKDRALFLEVAKETRATDAAFPYQYAFSNGAPMYNRVPTPNEQKRFERFLGPAHSPPKLPKSLRSHQELAANEAIPAGDKLPNFLSAGGATRNAPFDLVERTIPLGSMLSFTKTFEAEGRTWLLSTDHTIVPADRTRPFRPSEFRGVDLRGSSTTLPLAWIRKSAKPQYILRGDRIEKLTTQFAVRTSIELTGKRVEDAGLTYLETRASLNDAPIYLQERDATVVDVVKKRPFGVKEDQKWFIVSITNGTLTAYEGMTPIFTTLISPGVGGVPVPGRDPVKDSTTPLGTYTITFKDKAATMSPEKGDDRNFWIADVPHTQYFNPPFALHAAYWHERFGELVSAGCVNLSPLDAQTLFHWSDPQVPEGWQGVTGAGAPENGPTTAVVITR